ncbi:MAG: histidine phosphatase family protein [Anaerolineales bacterium]|nr:histidine phosphatase family protein [Anaerolineales bacterium]
MAVVWFIRHTESVSNANLRTVHPAETVLTPKGEAQARHLVGAFTAKPDLIVVSPFVRARQTAAPTITHLQPVAVETWPVYEFTYLAPARYRDTNADERLPWAQAYWQRNEPAHKDETEGESFAELLARVHALLARLRQRPERWIVIFSHGLFLRALFWVVLSGVETATAEAMSRYSHFVRAVQMPNGAICRAEVGGNGRVLLSGFDVAHLPEALRD